MSNKSKKKYRHIQSALPHASLSPAARGEDFNPDYSYVIKDLKRIGILAGTFFIILVVLSFIL